VTVIRSAVTVVTLGHPRLHLRHTDSTNERARALALGGAPHGTLVTAAEQTAGRGRQGRRWSAPAGSALLMSLLLRWPKRGCWSIRGCERSECLPNRSEASVPRLRSPTLLPLIAAVAVCDVAGPEARVKWPNDIVVERQPQPGRASLAKLAGILIEGRPQEEWAVLGIGINVAVHLEDLPPELHGSAATLGREPEAIEPLLAELLAALERRLGDPPALTLDAWRERDALRGREISWSTGRGRAEGVDRDGRLMVRLPDGGCTALDAGEVHLAPLA
jgi:BirA family transcriptional regulator, biotin operon repressor / biotin---[acetyl-CoA-carboxylase] ligase